MAHPVAPGIPPRGSRGAPCYHAPVASRGIRAGILAAVVVAVVAALLLLGGGERPPADPALRAPSAAPRAPEEPDSPVPAPPPPVAPTSPGAEAGEAEPPSPPPGAGILVVAVVGLPSAAPMEGASVELRDGEGRGEILGVRATGADGVARFEGLARDAVAVRVAAPGRVPESTYVSDLLLPGERSITVDLEPGLALGGIVLAASSRTPVPGARVVAELGGSIGGQSSHHSDPELTETVADGEGRFRVDGIPRNEIVTLSAEAPGFVRGGRSLMLGEGAEEHPPVELVLAPAARAGGVVLDPEGRPVPGASVRSWPADPGEVEGALANIESRQGPWGWGLGQDCPVKSGEDGRFTVEGLAVGVGHRFSARAPGFARSLFTDPPVAADAPGQELAVEIRLRRAASLRVLVVDAEGTPAAASRVHIDLEPGDRLAPDAGETGTFRFPDLPPGEYRVVAESAGFTHAAEAFVLAEGEAKEARMVLAAKAPPPPAEPAPPEAKPGTARLRLVPPPGETLPARYSASVVETLHGRGVGFTRALVDGLVVLEDLPAGPVRLVVAVEGYAPVVRDVEVGSGEERDLGPVTLDAGAELSGTVLDRAGRPLPGARVLVSLPGIMGDAVATAGTDGRYRVTRLPQGDLYVRVAAEGLLDGRETVAVGPGVTARAFTLVPPVRVRGTARDAAGKGVEESSVVFLLQDEAPPGVPRETTEYPGEEGVFDTEIAAGSYVVEVRDGKGAVLARAEAVFGEEAEGRIDLPLSR